VKAFYKSWIAAFPDAKVEVKAVTSTDNQAIEEGVFTGTHCDAFHGPDGHIPPTGRKVHVEYIQVLRYQGDMVSAFNPMFDRLDMMEQLGLAPAQEGSEARRSRAGRPDAALRRITDQPSTASWLYSSQSR